MAIGIKGSYHLQLDIDGNRDFIDSFNFQEFLIDESVGSHLPMYKLVFVSDDLKIIKYLNESKYIKCMFGLTKIDTVLSKLTIPNLKLNYLTPERVMISLTGVIGSMDYLITTDVNAYNNTSVGAISNAVMDYFNRVIINADANDRQSWLMTNITPREFVNKVWTRSSSIISVGATSDGNFIIQDWINNKNTEHKYNENNIHELFTHNVDYKNDSNLLNTLGGYSKVTNAFNIDSGDFNVIKPKNTQPLYSTNLIKNKNQKDIVSTTKIVNTSNNPNYLENRENIAASLMSLGGNSISVVAFGGKYYPFKLFDRVSIVLPNKATGKHHMSGKWVITRIKRFVVKTRFGCQLTLTRDGLNLIDTGV